MCFLSLHSQEEVNGGGRGGRERSGQKQSRLTTTGEIVVKSVVKSAVNCMHTTEAVMTHGGKLG